MVLGRFMYLHDTEFALHTVNQGKAKQSKAKAKAKNRGYK
jgi:hypothetical protein